MIDFDELTEEQRMCLKRQMLVDSQERGDYRRSKEWKMKKGV